MRLTVRVLGLELLHVELATEDDEPDDTARDLSGGDLASTSIDAGATDTFMGFTMGLGDGDE